MSEQLCAVVLDCRWALSDVQRKRARPVDTVRALAMAASPVQSPIAKTRAREAIARWVRGRDPCAPATSTPALSVRLSGRIKGEVP